jgi:hypothetical protein
MFCTDLVEDVAVYLAVKAAQSIPAKSIHVVLHNDLIPDLFQPNRRLSLALRHQERRTLSASCKAAVLSLRSLGRIHNEIAHDLKEANWIGQIVDHECRKRVGRI